MKAIWFVFSFVFAVSSYKPFSTGWRKLNYTGTKLSDAYVGGDAYNYIINSTQSTTFFVLAGILVFCSIGFLIVGYLHLIYENNRPAQDEKQESPSRQAPKVPVSVDPNELRCPHCGKAVGTNLSRCQHCERDTGY